MKQKLAKEILQATRHTYQTIAREFDQTRQELWPGFEKFLQYVKPHDRICDVGCGNGRLVKLFHNASIQYTGCDISEEQMIFAQKRYPDKNFVQGDILGLPFENDTFDAIFCIAVLHHIPGKELRRRAVRELWRVLKPGGKVILTVWDRYTMEFFPKILFAALLKLAGVSKLDFKDIFIPWGNTVKRYYHCFTLKEMESLVKDSGFTILKAYKESSQKRRNFVVIAQKL